MRSRFDEQLLCLNNAMIRMGSLCESAIESCVSSLFKGDGAFPEALSALGESISQAEREIESLCLRLLLQQQPVARDLRSVSAALKMITDMSRIGDQAVDIGEILSTGKALDLKLAPEIADMAKEAKAMLTKSIDAFVKGDLSGADAVIRRDDVVDDLFDRVRAALANTLREGTEGEAVLDLLMIAKYFERIADHAVNIAVWVEFSLTGIHRREI